MRASTTTARSGRPITGLRSSSASSGKSSASCESRWSTSASAAASAAGAPRKPADEPARLARADELVRVDVGQGREPEVRVADQLREHAAGAEGDERAEDGILRHAGEQLDAALDHRLHDHGAADPLGRGPHGFRVGEVECDAAASRSCAPRPQPSSRPRGSRAPRRLRPPRPVSSRTLRGRAEGRRPRGGVRVSAGSSQASSSCARAVAIDLRGRGVVDTVERARRCRPSGAAMPRTRPHVRARRPRPSG